MKRILLILLFLLFSSNAFSSGPVLPEGWRTPTESELSDEWRSGKYKQATAIGDFNGDGLIEGAFLAVSDDGKKEGLLAFVYVNHKEKWFVLNEKDLNKTVFMGLGVYKPGEYKVLCATDAECEQGYKKEITIKTDAFNYYRPASASSIFVWDKEKFQRIWESD